ncbi:HAMP domain-containing histidine kinase [Weissella ceti]|uniref:Signal transduction histidine-protein kinase ArlS n=1 Tax=Weissella ceti TaxID=759620 RepID=A0ABT3E610_9LACO|nr:HAMP domain-containing histidine kinase [Weissella ceti]MCW0953858.1 HAMP domain-containing histidine kinase [Weissella ceti]QVK12592.1 HAMP domain-containing histidine kinase [Weissella ceti]
MAILKTITKRAPDDRPISLQRKWTFGSIIGVFFVFITFAWFLITAFSNQLIQTEKVNLTASMETVATELQRFKTDDLTVNNVDKLNETMSPAVQQMTRADYQFTIYNDSATQIYPFKQNEYPFKKGTSFDLKQINHNYESRLVAEQPLYNRGGDLIGYLQGVNTLATLHATFKRIYLIILVSIVLGLILLSIWNYWLVNYLTQPVKAMTNLADEIRRDPNSPERVTITTRHNDELTGLASLLNSMLDQIQSFISQQQRFVEDVSHELRTPVAIVKGHMELLNRWGKDDPKILAESIEASLQEISRMQGLVQEMLDMTRADQVELAFKKENTDVRQVVQTVFANYQMITPDFTFYLDDDLNKPTFVNMSRDHLEQILIILTDNAVKYSQTRLEIHFAMAKHGHFVEIAIQDFGEGLTPEDADHVFDRFFRVDKARSRKQGGNGLGLSIAQKLIEGYGGQIWLESAINEGSIFHIKLPINK